MPANIDSGGGKEETIRGLLERCRVVHREIQGLLEKNFNRQPKEDEKTPGAPSRPNVLDEIIDGLVELGKAQTLTINFFIKNVNPKL